MLVVVCFRVLEKCLRPIKQCPLSANPFSSRKFVFITFKVNICILFRALKFSGRVNYFVGRSGVDLSLVLRLCLLPVWLGTKKRNSN